MTLRKNKKERLHLFDGVRGLCILGMVLYHALFDGVYVYGLFFVPQAVLDGSVYMRDLGCVLFVLLGGICEHFGTEKYKRAFLLLGIGTGISLISCIFMPQQAVVFGVLSFMGAAGLLLQPLKKLLLRHPAGLFAGFAALFFLFFSAAYGRFGMYGLQFGAVPSIFYANTATAILGFPPPTFSSSDYFPIFPWLFLYFAGYCLFPLLQKRKSFHRFAACNIKPLAFVGRYSLWFYLAHQPILLGMFWLISKI